jgi:F0F1-type ATP synthase delta subunit
MAKRLKDCKSDEEMLNNSKAVIEHHFDNHEYCGNWCHHCKQSEEERKKKFYRCKDKDAALYKQLKEMLARFLTIDALKEVAHNLDTCVNESMNQVVSWLAPKNKSIFNVTLFVDSNWNCFGYQ